MPFSELESQIRLEYENLQALFESQSPAVKRFINQQAELIIANLKQPQKTVQLVMPVQLTSSSGASVGIQAKATDLQRIHFSRRLKRQENRALVMHALREMEVDSRPGVSDFSILLKLTVASDIIYKHLPDGRAIHYQAAEFGEIPSQPLGELPGSGPAITDHLLEPAAGTDAVLNDPVPYVPYARLFFIPRWVALDDKDRLLTGSEQEAEALVASLQNAVALLEDAEAICPCIVADEAFQRKRAGLLGELVNQGCALARYFTRTIINSLHQLAGTGGLDRGLKLDLPYFDFTTLSMGNLPVEIFPASRIQFVPAFVVRAMQLTSKKIQQNPDMHTATRRHLTQQLIWLEDEFNTYLK